jgi:Inner membrane protein YqiJ, N-terminal
MSELLYESFRLVNLPFTILLILVVVYWLLVAIGALSGPSPDADLDLDAHADVDLDAHHQVEGHHSGHGHHDGSSTWGNVLKFVNLGDVPVMVVLSILILSLWSFGVVANRYFTGGSYLLAAVFLVANFGISAVVTRYVTLPLKPVFRLLNKQYDEPVKIIGQHCRVITTEATPDFGQAEITTNGAPILINVRTLNDAMLAKGDLAVVVREDTERRIFFITPNPLPNPS